MADDLFRAAEQLRIRDERGRARATIRPIIQLQNETSRAVRCGAVLQLALVGLQGEWDEEEACELCWDWNFRNV